MQDNDATRIIGVIDNRIEKKMRVGGTTETTWGEVAAISADGKSASAYLYGETEIPSEGFRLPGTLAVSVGDIVKVAWDGRGERWVADVAIPSAYKRVAINPNTGEILQGDGTVEPTAFGGVPTGVVVPFAGPAAPDGWLLCDGSAVSRTTYADLYAIVGDTYGAGDGSTTFNLPDLQQRFPLGKGPSGTGSTLGEAGGEIDHDHTSAAHDHSHSHSTPAHAHSHSHSMQSHTHTLSHTHASAAHSHPLSSAGYAKVMMTANVIRMSRITSGVASWSYNFQNVFAGNASGSGTETAATELDGDTDSATPGSTGAASTSTTSGPSTASTDTHSASGGSGTSGSDATPTTPGNTGINNPPYLALNYVIKA